jgi:hypothetical protein
VQVAVAAWRAATRTMAGVGGLVQRTGDGRTGRVLGCQTVKRWVTVRERGVGAFALYIVYFTFLLHFSHTHINHFASHVILACICLIMLIIVLG